jgi:integrase
MKKTLTDRTIQSLRPAASGKAFDMWDTEVRGFGVRIQGDVKHPTRSFILRARYPGSRNPTRRLLGRYGELSLAEARDKAREWLNLIRKGIDPAHEEERQRIAALRRQNDRFSARAEEYISIGLTGLRTADDAAREIRRELIGAWGDRSLYDITKQDVRDLTLSFVKRGVPMMGRAVFGRASSLFNWLVETGVIDVSPCYGLNVDKLTGRIKVRDRAFDDIELRAFWRAVSREGYPYQQLFRLLLLTGLRRSEVAEGRWSEIDMTKRQWVIPRERMKGEEHDARPHCVPLTDDIMQELRSLPRFKSGDYLFSSDYGRKPVVAFARVKKRLERRMRHTIRALKGRDAPEVPPWRIHDIRRTMRTNLSAIKAIPPHIRERLLAHAQPGIERVYDVFEYAAEKLEGLQLWHERLASIVEPNKPRDNGGNVVRLRA